MAQSGVAGPLRLAQPESDTSWLRVEDDCSARSFTSLLASGSCWALTTQNGTSAATTAISARSLATRSASLADSQPMAENPKVDMTKAPRTTPHSVGLTQTGIFIGCLPEK